MTAPFTGLPLKSDKKSEKFDTSASSVTPMSLPKNRLLASNPPVTVKRKSKLAAGFES